MPNKSKHAFGALERIDSAMASGAINAYDILFVKDANGKPYIGWIDKNGKKTVIDYVTVNTITELEELIATRATAEEVEAKISTSASSTLAAAKSYAESLAANSGSGAAATVQAKLDAEITRAKSREDAIANLVATAQGEIDDLEEVVRLKATQSDLNQLIALIGTIPATATSKNIVAYIQEKTAGISTDTSLTELTGRVAQAEADIAAIEASYLKAGDIANLTNNISNIQIVANTAQNLASEAKTQVNNLSTTYATDRAAFTAADLSQTERIIALENIVSGLSGAMNFKGVVNSDPTAGDFDVSEYVQGDVVIFNGQEYVFSNGRFVMFGSTSVEGGAVSNLSGRIDLLETDVNNIKTSMSSFNEAISGLHDANIGLENRIEVLENGSGAGITDEVFNAIKQAAVEEAIVNATSKDEALEATLKKYIDNQDAIAITAVDEMTASVSLLTGKMTLAESNIAKNKAAQEATQASLDSAIARIAKNEKDIANFVPGSGTGEGVDTSALLATLKEYVDEAVAQTTQVQIITWEADD